ncbi:MAG: response regulator [Pseudanabaenaceae cyanobacterium]|jgi:adenylate cyclase
MGASQRLKPKLLVIDDEPDNLDLLYRTFHREYKVLRAESGPEAMNILANEGEVAVIISDQRMPVMSGTEFLSQMVIQYPDTMRIILTGYTDVEDLVEAINACKVFKYVTKPWDESDLRMVVKQAVETHNVLKNRTMELRRALRRESLLNALASVLNQSNDCQHLCQAVVEHLGKSLEVDYCVLRPTGEANGEANRDGITAVYCLSGADNTADNSPDDNMTGRSCNIDVVRFDPQILPVEEIQVLQNLPHDHPQALWLKSLGMKSALIVPLRVQQECYAILALYRSYPEPWSPADQELVSLVADQAALALSRVRAYEQVQALANREALINSITTVIRSSLDPQSIFAAISQELGRALQADGCALSLWGADDDRVRCVALYLHEEDGDMVNTHPPQSPTSIADNPILQQLIETKQPVAVHDLHNSGMGRMVDLSLRSPARALLVVPLQAEGRIIGSISLRQIHQPRHWQPHEISLAQAVAAQAAIAVQQAYLYQKTHQQAQKLLELDRQKTEFFQNISHEFRTPLTLTIGPLEESINNNQPLDQEQSLVALRNCRRLLRLVNQLLDLQRLDAGKMQATFHPCNLRTIISQTLEAFQSYCLKKNIYLSTTYRGCPPVYLDVDKFDKVLYNLLSNAMKFTNSGGSIMVRLEAYEDSCMLEVQDTGIGIRDDQLEHLFERFRQAEGSVNRSYEGSGLGLALVKELVELHGGTISVKSVYGQGTTFTVMLRLGHEHLPIEQVSHIPLEGHSANLAAVELADIETELDNENEVNPVPLNGLAVGVGESSLKAAQQSTPSGSSYTAENNGYPESRPVINLHDDSSHETKVLVVDDNGDLRAYLRRVLTAAGYVTITARNGQQGFEQAQKHRPDLIVTDLMMPHVSGLDLIRMIRQDAQLQGTPIVLLTAKANEETRIEGTEQGADAYLAKPFNDRELMAEVRNLIALKANERRVSRLNNYLTQSVLQRFLPASLVEKAARGELSLDLRPVPRMITVLFSDIVGFTELANTLRSRRTAEILNQYLAAMSRAVFANGGTVDKFMGDGVLALFGAPEEYTPNEQVRRAVRTARQMKQALAELNQIWQEESPGHRIPAVRFRCGIHQGTAVVGMFGSKERSDYTAIGPTVNIASRIQEAADPDCILVSAAVADYLEEEDIEKRQLLNFKGVDESILTFLVNT